MKTIYALLTLIGVALPFSQFARWLIEHGFNFTLFFSTNH
ncbi:DUF2834 domain-containing protein [Acinetobacter sp. 8I-beige]|nr:DUF2834 domain-containing protein [Acinetobacter sp. 8I-beige]